MWGQTTWLSEPSAQEIEGGDIMLSSVTLKLQVLGEQFEDNSKALSIFQPGDITPALPGVHREQLQGTLWGQRLPQLLLTPRRKGQLWWIQ